MKNKTPYDPVVIITVALLVTTGIIMVFSSSFSYAMVDLGDGYYFLKRIIIWAIIGVFAMYFCAKFNYRNWTKYANIILLISIILLILVITPLGKEVNGAKRWIAIGPITVMPSEITKFAAIIFVSTSITRKRDKMESFFHGVVPYLILSGIFFLLIKEQPDYSTALVIVLIIISMIFVGGMKLSHFIGLALSGSIAFVGLLFYIVKHGKGYRAKRLTAFLDPWADPTDSGFQAIQSLLALGSGGLFGKGLGRSIQKHFYLPEPQNDFIFAIIGEELGFIGGVFVIILFMLLIWRGIRIAMYAPDLLGCVMATGITCMLIIQVLINIAVATSSMPVTGIPLPFISFGGNALVIFMASMGILLNISKNTNMNRG
ncbi:MAG: putative lipid II flippase FtsW [Clostridiales bacterium]|nr:putative lipid II flippase FtsW [Clostridiales bacterium]